MKSELETVINFTKQLEASLTEIRALVSINLPIVSNLLIIILCIFIFKGGGCCE